MLGPRMSHLFINLDCPLAVNWAMAGYSPLCKRGVRGDLDVARMQKSPSIPLLQRGKLVEFSNGLFGINVPLSPIVHVGSVSMMQIQPTTALHLKLETALAFVWSVFFKLSPSDSQYVLTTSICPMCAPFSANGFCHHC